jgi:hypothetical protein
MDDHRILVFGKKLPALIYGGNIGGARTPLPIDRASEKAPESHPLGHFDLLALNPFEIFATLLVQEGFDPLSIHCFSLPPFH